MRFYVVGTSGSGKSTLAKKISQKMDIPHIELDAYRFQKNWDKLPKQEFQNVIEEKIKPQRWSACGYASQNLKEILFDKATHIIWLDYPLWFVFYRVVVRTFRRILFKEKCCGNNQETLYQQFCTKYSIFLWVLQTYPMRKKEFTAMLDNPQYRDKMVHITSQKQADEFVSKL